jgi:hypothetical protein
MYRNAGRALSTRNERPKEKKKKKKRNKLLNDPFICLPCRGRPSNDDDGVSCLLLFGLVKLFSLFFHIKPPDFLPTPPVLRNIRLKGFSPRSKQQTDVQGRAAIWEISFFLFKIKIGKACCCGSCRSTFYLILN